MDRKRRPNWTEEDKLVLLQEYKKRKAILQSKFDPNITQNENNCLWQCGNELLVLLSIHRCAQSSNQVCSIEQGSGHTGIFDMARL